MIPALIIWLYKKYIMPAAGKQPLSIKPGFIRNLYSKIVLLVLFPCLLFAEERISVYHIKHNDVVIGQLNFSQKTNGRDTYLSMDSQVKTRFVFGINVKTSDYSHFSNGTLVSSNVYRSVNGKEKENKRTSLNNNFYQILSGSTVSRFDKLINYNMMMLYTREPLNTTQVYSDNFQQFITIKRTAPHSYRIRLPDGNYNDYYFQNGVCQLVVIHHSMYTIKMELAKTS